MNATLTFALVTRRADHGFRCVSCEEDQGLGSTVVDVPRRLTIDHLGIRVLASGTGGWCERCFTLLQEEQLQ
jgi:hypothetical protein